MRVNGWRIAMLGIGLVMGGAAPGMLEAAVGAGSEADVARSRADGARSRAGGRLWHDGAVVSLREARYVPIPSFSRQTRLPCTSCHTTFPQLTNFGRMFKLNGYTMVGIEQVVQNAPDSTKSPWLALDLIPPISVMFEVSFTNVKATVPGTQNNDVEFPDQFSLFYGGAIAPRIGSFIQFTYAGVDGAFGMDNVDIRFAGSATLDKRPLIYGLTLNNNPTVQDVFNTLPAWTFPYASSSDAPTPTATPILFNDLGATVGGLGGYVFWNNLLYLGVTGYRSAPQGGAHPPDATSEMTISGVAPYWRAALTQQFGPRMVNNVEIGTYGMSFHEYPTGVSGATDDFTDVGVDGQYQREAGPTLIGVHATYLHENQEWDASFPLGLTENPTDKLHTWRVDGSVFFPRVRLGATLAYFNISGSVDNVLYAPEPVFGSANGSPNSNGFIGQIEFNPWLNARLLAQYVAYHRFNGGTDNYDGFGRDASDNNTLYLLAWLVF